MKAHAPFRSDPNEVTPISSRQIPHPFHTIVISFLKHLQEPDQQPTRSEHQDLEIDRDWGSAPRFPNRRLSQRGFCCERRIRLSLESRNPISERRPTSSSVCNIRAGRASERRRSRERDSLPNDDIFSRYVFSFAQRDFTIYIRRIEWSRNLDDNIVRR